MKMRSAKHSCIGAINGDVNTKIRMPRSIIDSEGDYATGIGDPLGSGNVFIMDSAVTMKMQSEGYLVRKRRGSDTEFHCKLTGQ